MNEFHILLVEDNRADADLIREYLTEITEFEPTLHCVSTLSQAKSFLEKNAVHAVLVDLSLPDSRGLETLREVVGLMRGATAIVLTSLDDKNMAMNAMASGAQDYLLKNSMGPESLARVIRYSMQRSQWYGKMREMRDQFHQGQKMESIGRMAGGIAHDFNNQLGAIGLLTSLCQESVAKDHESQEILSRIQTVVERASELTKRLMVFCRKHPSEMAVIDISEILSQNQKLITKLMGEKIRVDVSFGPGCTVMGNAGLFEQAMMNLAINARDAMPDGGTLTLSASLECRDRDARVLLKVSDTGTGMSDATAARVFDPFFTTKKEGQGTGLGLSMVYGTVKQFGGDIELETQLGFGTTFLIAFPQTVQRESVGVASPGPKTAKGRKTILLVEDEDVLRGLISRVLTRNGYRVLSAANGVEALGVLRRTGARVDLMISDMMMPQMGGAELGVKVREMYPGTRILFSSGYSGDADKTPALQDASFISKPASTKDLLAKVREVLDT